MPKVPTRIFRWPVTVQASRIRGSNIELAVVNGTLTPEEGLKQLQKSLELWPNNIDAMLQRAVLLTQLSARPKPEEKSFTFLISIQVTNKPNDFSGNVQAFHLHPEKSLSLVVVWRENQPTNLLSSA